MGFGAENSQQKSALKEVSARVDSGLGNFGSVAGTSSSVAGGGPFNMINEIFPPSMFSYGQNVID